MCHRCMILNSNDINLNLSDVLIGMITHNLCFSSTFSMSLSCNCLYRMRSIGESGVVGLSIIINENLPLDHQMMLV